MDQSLTRIETWQPKLDMITDKLYLMIRDRRFFRNERMNHIRWFISYINTALRFDLRSLLNTAQYDGDKTLNDRQFDFNLNAFGNEQSDGKIFFCTDDSFNFVTTTSPTASPTASSTVSPTPLTPTTTPSSSSSSSVSTNSPSTPSSCNLGPDFSSDHGEITVYSPTPNGGNCDLPWDFYSNQGLSTMQFFAALPKNSG